MPGPGFGMACATDIGWRTHSLTLGALIWASVSAERGAAGEKGLGRRGPGVRLLVAAKDWALGGGGGSA